MTARELFDQGARWTDTAARAAFPVLLGLARCEGRIPYGDLNKALVSRGHPSKMAIDYRYVAGKIGDICQALGRELGAKIPPLNTLVVNQKTKLPSNGVDIYLADFLAIAPKQLAGLALSDRNALAEQAIRSVHEFDGWPRIAARLGIKMPKPPKTVGKGTAVIPLPNPLEFARGAESPEHKALKEWVAKHPTKFGFKKMGRMEFPLSSGDRLDVHFEDGNERLAVEVKSEAATESEVQRGVYQCVKYRAVIRAMQLAAIRAPNAQALLIVGGQVSGTITRLADRLNVRVIQVKR